jgi:hypothetical protein
LHIQMKNQLLKSLVVLLLVSCAACRDSNLASFSGFMNGHELGNTKAMHLQSALPVFSTDPRIAIINPTGFVSKPTATPNKSAFMDITVDAELIQPFFDGSKDNSVYVRYFNAAAEAKLKTSNIAKPMDVVVSNLKMHEFQSASNLIAVVKATSSPAAPPRVDIRFDCSRIYETMVAIRKLKNNTKQYNASQQNVWSNLIKNLNVASTAVCKVAIDVSILNSK